MLFVVVWKGRPVMCRWKPLGGGALVGPCLSLVKQVFLVVQGVSCRQSGGGTKGLGCGGGRSIQMVIQRKGVLTWESLSKSWGRGDGLKTERVDQA